MSSHMDFIKEQLYATDCDSKPFPALQRKRQIICYPN